MGHRVAAYDWSAHPLGPIEEWPPWMRNTAELALLSRFSTVPRFGRELFIVHNDAYLRLLLAGEAVAGAVEHGCQFDHAGVITIEAVLRGGARPPGHRHRHLGGHLHRAERPRDAGAASRSSALSRRLEVERSSLATTVKLRIPTDG